MPPLNSAKRQVFYLGIDPGKSGGMAAIDSLGVIIACKMPGTPADILEWLRDFGDSTCRAIIEQVGGYVGVGQPGSAMFNFGKGVGHLEMAMLACRIPAESVPPRKWQKAMGISSRKKTETKTQWKNRLKLVAQRLFPSEKVTLAIADALLIALYCQRKHEGTL